MYNGHRSRIPFKVIALLLLALAALCAPAWATNYYVKENGTGAAASSSWTNPTSLTDAIAAANSGSDNIYVAKGTYTLTAMLTLNSNVNIYGGYPTTSTGTTLGDRDLTKGATTISGNNTFTLISVTGGSPTIDGFTITDGKGNCGDYGACGGGIYISTTATNPVTVQNCVIESNSNSDTRYGGGMCIEQGKLNVTNSVFQENQAWQGGGMYVKEGASATVTQCTFINNTAQGNAASSVSSSGGGLYASGSVEVTNCTFTENKADTVYENYGGGGLYVNNSDGNSVKVNYCTFVGNTGEPGANIYNTGTSFTVTNSLLYYTGTAHIYGVTLDYCATATGEGENGVKISTWATRNSKTPDTGIPHTVFRYDENPALIRLIGNGKDTTVTVDQLDNLRNDTKPDIGAVEFDTTQVKVTTDPATTSIHGTVGVELTKNNSVTFSTTPNLSYTWGIAPNGNGITDDKVKANVTGSNKLTFSGTPSKTGNYTITLKGTSTTGPDLNASVKLNVGEIKVEAGETSIECKAGDTLNETVMFTAEGGTAYNWVKEKVDGAISGVTVGDIIGGNTDNTGKGTATLTFTGTPKATGKIIVTVKATNTGVEGGSGTASVTLTVSDPEINVSSGTEGTSISTNINTQISNKTLTFEATPAALNCDWTLDTTEQGGLMATLSSSGNTATLTLNGTPTKAESYTFTVKAAFGNTKKEVTVTVNVNDPSVTVTADPSTLYAQAGKELVPANCKSNLMASSASGGSENWTWTVVKAELDGVKATLSATTGSNVTLTLSGTPREIKDYTFTVRAAAGSKANTATVTLKVTAPGGITLTPSATEAIALVGNTVFYPSEISFDAAPSQNYAWTVDGGSSAEKDGITATLTGSGNTAKLAFSGTPTAEGSYKFNVAAAFGGVAASQDITVTVYKPDVGFESVNDPNLISKMEQDFMNLLNGVPAGTKIYFNMEGVRFADPEAFLIQVRKQWEKKGWAVIANISPVMVENPGVYFMKLNMSDDKRAMMTNSFNVDYHVERSADIEVSGTENNVVKVAADPAKDGSNGILVDEEGNPLGTYYNGSDLYLLVYLARSNEWYVQYLTMEQNFNGPTSNKGPGCDHSCNSGFVGTSAAALLVLLFAPTGSKRKEKK